MEVPEERYLEIGDWIESEDSPVGIDAKKTHIMILYLLQDLGERLARIEDRLKMPAR